MPVYEFRCRNCGEEFSLELSWREKDKACCPACGAKDVQQLFRSITILGGASQSKNCSAPSGGRFT